MFSEDRLVLNFVPSYSADGKDVWVVNASYDGRKMMTPFHARAGLSHDELRELWLKAVGDDAYAVVENDEQGWFDEMGYDTEDPGHWAIRDAVLNQTEELKRLLGDDFDSFVYEEYKQAQAPIAAS